MLLNYSEKLWGLPCNQLSPNIAGNRLKGLNLKNILKETVLCTNDSALHLDGSFYYPQRGIGTIVEKLADFCGEETIRKCSKISNIFHDGKQIYGAHLG